LLSKVIQATSPAKQKIKSIEKITLPFFIISSLKKFLNILTSQYYIYKDSAVKGRITLHHPLQCSISALLKIKRKQGAAVFCKHLLSIQKIPLEKTLTRGIQKVHFRVLR
jgi:hypothetical protein